jgi:hypothetical protein
MKPRSDIYKTINSDMIRVGETGKASDLSVLSAMKTWNLTTALIIM